MGTTFLLEVTFPVTVDALGNGVMGVGILFCSAVEFMGSSLAQTSSLPHASAFDIGACVCSAEGFALEASVWVLLRLKAAALAEYAGITGLGVKVGMGAGPERSKRLLVEVAGAGAGMDLCAGCTLGGEAEVKSPKSPKESM